MEYRWYKSIVTVKINSYVDDENCVKINVEVVQEGCLFCLKVFFINIIVLQNFPMSCQQLHCAVKSLLP